MANQNQATNTAAASGNADGAEATKTRETRANKKAAESIQITDLASAQKYQDTVLADTKADTAQRMFNGSGFTTPSVLFRESPANLVRMGVSLISALAAQVGAEGEDGEAARNGLQLIGEFTNNAGLLQEESRRRNALINAGRAMGQKGSNDEVLAHMLKTNGTTWEAVQKSIRAEFKRPAHA